MAEVNINASPRRFEAGGRILINDGTDDHILANLEVGTLQIEEGGFGAIIDMDRSQLPDVVREGDEQPSRISFTPKFNWETSADDLRTLAMAASTGGLKKLYTIVLQCPDSRGATTGKQVTFTKCFFNHPQALTTGREYDGYPVTLISMDNLGTWADYGS